MTHSRRNYTYEERNYITKDAFYVPAYIGATEVKSVFMHNINNYNYTRINSKCYTATILNVVSARHASHNSVVGNNLVPFEILLLLQLLFVVISPVRSKKPIVIFDIH